MIAITTTQRASADFEWQRQQMMVWLLELANMHFDRPVTQVALELDKLADRWVLTATFKDGSTEEMHADALTFRLDRLMVLRSLDYATALFNGALA